jgi:DNA polymerase I-like protein with 3'-5' exonuclease and polymerase domains
MHYPNLRKIEGQWIYQDGRTVNKLYGGKLIENLVQHMARVYIMQVALKMLPYMEQTGSRFVLQAHDELVFTVPNPYVDDFKQLLHHEMVTAPKWATGLPLHTDVKSGPNYGNLT